MAMSASVPQQSDDHHAWIITDVLLVVLIGAVSLLMGGRHPLGKLVYVALVSSMAVLWGARQCFGLSRRWRRSGVELLLAAALLLVGVELIPLPETWLAVLSPSLSTDLTLWSAACASPARLGHWTRLSLTPTATREGLAVLLAHAMLLVVVLQRLRTVEDIERMLRWLAILAIAMATLGLAQYFTSNGKFLWVYQHPSRDTFSAVKGTLANENHFAHVLALGLGPLLWYLVRAWQGEDQNPSPCTFGPARWDSATGGRKVMLAFGLGLVVFAGLLSYSRGGILVMLLVAATTVGIYAWNRRLGKRAIWTLVTAASIVAAALWVHGYQSLRGEMETLASGSMETVDQNRGRRKIWAADWAAICRYPIVGTGVGSHREVYPTYFAARSNVEYTHAESGYLQVLLETGAAGFTLLVLGMGACGWWCWGALRHSQSARLTTCAAAVTAGLVASAVHSVFDFVWYLPVCMVLTIILAACACRLYQLATRHRVRQRRGVELSRGQWLAVELVTVLLAATMVHTWLGPGQAAPYWDRYLALSLAQDNKQGLAVLDRGDSKQYRSFVRATVSMKQQLWHVLQYDADHPRAHLRMAAMCLRLFDHYQHFSENSMTLAQIRDAALASGFASLKAQDRWLAVAVGGNRKYLDQALQCTHRALRLCPLQGQGYIFLAELAFLEGQGGQVGAAYVGQALKLRPYQATVLFAAGREAALTGQPTLALDLWARAFRQDREQQQALITLLAPRMPASLMMSHFRPDLEGTRMLLRQYQQLGRGDQARQVGIAYAAMLEHQAAQQRSMRAVHLWQQAQAVHRQLGQNDQATACIEKAVAQAPNDFNLRYGLALSLYEQRQYGEAVEHLTWCLRRKPSDIKLRRLLRRTRQQLQSSDRHANIAVRPLLRQRR